VSDDILIFGSDGGVSISINALEDGQYTIELYDVLGKRLTSELKNVAAGNNHFKLNPGNLASAIYIVKVYNQNNSITKKVFIRSKE
jgi:hypothetical protein